MHAILSIIINSFIANWFKKFRIQKRKHNKFFWHNNSQYKFIDWWCFTSYINQNHGEYYKHYILRIQNYAQKKKVLKKLPRTTEETLPTNLNMMQALKLLSPDKNEISSRFRTRGWNVFKSWRKKIDGIYFIIFHWIWVLKKFDIRRWFQTTFREWRLDIFNRSEVSSWALWICFPTWRSCVASSTS